MSDLKIQVRVVASEIYLRKNISSNKNVSKKKKFKYGALLCPQISLVCRGVGEEILKSIT